MKGKIILGMMRIAKLGVKETDRLVRPRAGLGIDFLVTQIFTAEADSGKTAGRGSGAGPRPEG